MTTRADLRDAFERMIGRKDAAEIELRRAIRDGRAEDMARYSRASTRRIRAALRISKAMRKARV
jgi:hypothetical protein